MEIERKFLVIQPPENYRNFPCRKIEQGYLNIRPVVRVRRADDQYFLTYKSAGLLAREEYELPLTEEAYLHLREKCDGNILTKTRYLLPLDDAPHLTVELDVFEGIYEGLILAEVEFPTEEEALRFTPPGWLSEDVTMSGRYQNSRLSRISPEEL